MFCKSYVYLIVEIRLNFYYNFDSWIFDNFLSKLLRKKWRNKVMLKKYITYKVSGPIIDRVPITDRYSYYLLR